MTATVVVIQHDPSMSMSRPSWRMANWLLPRAPLFTCPNGHNSVMSNHPVQSDGTVIGSVQCPECEFHAFVKLAEWDWL